MRYLLCMLPLVCCHAVTAISNSSYLTNEELYDFMRQANRNYPNITHLYSIGNSIQGRELLVLALSATQPDEHVLLRPETKYIGNIHGNEATSREVLVRFIQHMLENYDKDNSVTNLMMSTRIHVMPTMNPDGYERSIEGRCEGSKGRYNDKVIDLNRNFPDVFDLEYQKRESMQPETLAVADWIDSQQFVLSANFHGGSLVVNYPYDSSPKPHSWESFGRPSVCEDDDTFQYISRKYSFAHTNLRQGTCPVFKDGITNGAEWYVAQGTMQDYNYVYSGCMELTIEIGCCKFPFFTEIEEIWQDNKLALTTYLEQVNIGVKGIVTASDGLPAAGIHICVDDRMNVTTTLLGEYWKLVLPGTYTLNVTVEDMVLESIAVSVPDSGVAIYNITLSYPSTYIYNIRTSPVVGDNNINISNTLNIHVYVLLAAYIIAAAL